MAWSAVSSAVTTIGKLLAEEAVYLWGVEEQVDSLQTELKWMQIFLRKVEAKPALAKDEIIRLWMSEIRELAYDAEDVIEDFALRIGSRRNDGCIQRSARIFKRGRRLHETRSKIDKIFTRITDLVRRLQAYGIKELREDEESSSTERWESRRPYPHIIEDNIVGLETDIKNLVSIIMDEKSESRVVSICGQGGLGKTTLAKKIYQHSQVKKHFDHLVWVYVSEHCQKIKVWADMLSGLNIPLKIDWQTRDEDIAKELFNFLKEKKCLLVLDDIWNNESWDSIKPAIPDKETRTKILFTSRKTEIVSDADNRGYLHSLQILGKEQSWNLFQKIVLSQASAGRIVEGEMEKVGREMVEHCGGLPLAIVVLGGILATKDSLNEWQMVSENVISYLKRGKGHGVEEVLALSYDDLPHYLRPCFLYLANYPEDFEIQTDRLIQLWVAEGIVLSDSEEDDGIMIEDLAERYLLELVQRCMVQVRERDVLKLKIKTVEMHDSMRNLCLSKAKQENFLCFVDETSNASSISTVRRMHRVSAPNMEWIQHIKSPNLRSLLFFGEISEKFIQQMKGFRNPVFRKMFNYWENHEEEGDCLFGSISLLFLFFVFLPEFHGYYTYMFNNFKLLRVFSYEGKHRDGMGVNWKLSRDIGNLIHLRFLSLRGLKLFRPILPSTLGNLRRLQNLDLRVEGMWPDVHVPNVIWRMEQLRHLYLPDNCKRRTKLELSTLRNLQTLVNFNTRNCYLKDLINMTKLRELVIRGRFEIKDFNVDNSDKNPPIIQSKYLHSLSIINDEGRIDPRHLNHLLSTCASLCKLSLDVKISELPEYDYSSSSLAYLNLGMFELEKDPMPTLEKMSSLRVLELHDGAFKGKEIVCSAQGFPKLESLSLKNVRHLEKWKVDEGAMPCLERLEIKNCRDLKMVPDGLRFITTLKELKIEGMPKAFKERMEEGGEDFDKVRHVPSITFEACDN